MALVVARYNENLDWVNHFPKKYIYNKGNIDTIPDDLKQDVINLPNVGREAHTYLYHIIENYDNLDDVTIFSQGMYSDHCNMTPENFREKFSNIDGYSRNYVDTTCWGHNRRHYNFNLQYWKGELKHNDLIYGPWFEKFFGETFQHSPFAYGCAIFSVSKNLILKRPKSFYEKLIKELEYDNSPIEGHFMERSWMQVFFINV